MCYAKFDFITENIEFELLTAFHRNSIQHGELDQRTTSSKGGRGRGGWSSFCLSVCMLKCLFVCPIITQELL